MKFDDEKLWISIINCWKHHVDELEGQIKPKHIDQWTSAEIELPYWNSKAIHAIFMRFQLIK